MRKVISSLIVVCLFGMGSIIARAQSGARLNLYHLQTDDFPTMTAGLDVFDSAGNLVSGLRPDTITLLEDGQPVPVNTLEELPVGVQFAVAFDPGPTFASRGISGGKRYDSIEQVLKDWATTHDDSLGDDLSFVPTEGTVSAHLTTGAAFSDALTVYSPALLYTTPSLGTLSQALDAVSEAPPQEGMKRAVLFVTSPPTSDALPTLQDLTQRARGQDIRVFVWIVTSPAYFSTSGADALRELATQTGGQYILFSGEEPLPGLETYLVPLRDTYRLTYTSSIRSSGGHSLVAQVDLNGETVTSQPVTFELDIQPPNPMLVAPPEQVVRSAPDENTTNPTAFLPSRQAIDVLVEFPDGRTRPLVSTVLYVDDQKVAENTSPPFDRFTWDLSGYTVSGQHLLQVEAVDDLGLSKVSVGVPVTVTVVQPQAGLLSFLGRNRLWVALGAILVSGVLLGAILVGSRTRRAKRVGSRGSRKDPLTQPVPGELARRGMRLPWARPLKQPEAYLVRLREDGQPMNAPSVPILVPTMSFGSDPLQVTRILDDPSVSPLHARLSRENGEYILADEGSTAGTWVNYEQLTAPRRLQHGDVLHIGRLSYRFMLHKPPTRTIPKITPTRP
jgi:hypothetical protein